MSTKFLSKQATISRVALTSNPENTKSLFHAKVAGYMIVKSSKKVLIVAGEASGDLHASNLIRATHNIAPQIQFYGMGGVQMQAAGAKLTHDLKQVSVIGLVEVLGRLPQILRTLKELAHSLATEKPDIAILVDFPDFNLRLAAKLKKAGIPVIWYISPQIWAWRAERITKIMQLVDYMLVILPFEVDFYKRHNLNVTFVGHPLIDKLTTKLSPTEARQHFDIKTEDPLIALLPGSRNIEIKLLLPHLLHAAEILYKRNPRYQFVLPVANSLDPQAIQTRLTKIHAPIKVVTGATYEVVAAADVAVVAAGTATLETALLNTPEIIIGRVTRLTWWLWSKYTKLPYYGLPNYILDEKLITELIQYQADGESIAQQVENLLTSETQRRRLQDGYQRIHTRLGTGGASQRVAQVLLDILAGNDQPYRLLLK